MEMPKPSTPANWVSENKDTVVKVAAVTGAVVAAGVVTVATAGAGAPAAAMIVAGAVAGATGAGVATVGANVALDREWNEDLVENVAIGTAIGITIGTAGAVHTYGVSGTVANLQQTFSSMRSFGNVKDMLSNSRINYSLKKLLEMK